MEEIKVTPNKKFEIDFDKVKTIEDVVEVLKSLEIKITWYQDECPTQFLEIQKRGLLKEVLFVK